MAWLFADSFDLYLNTNAATFAADAATHWDTAVSGVCSPVLAANTRFTSGNGIVAGPASGAFPTGLVKSSGSNDAGHHLVFAYKNNGVTTVANGLTFTFMDGATAQCSVVFDPSGTIYLKSGLGAGTVLDTYSAGLSLSTWYGVEIEVVIHNSAGSFKVRLNGNTSDDHSATGLNTRGGTANNYANKIQIGTTASIASNAQWIDDFLWFSTSGSAPNTWVGDIRAQTLMPTTDGTVGLTASSGTVALATVAGGANSTPPANTLVTSAILTATYGGTVTGINITIGATFTGHYKLAIYDGTSGAPGALLAQTAEQTNGVTGAITVPLIANITIASAAKLYLAILTDATMTNNVTAATGVSTSRAYGSGFPSSLVSSTPGIANLLCGSMNVVTSNSSQVAQSTEDSDTSFVYGSTASVGDLYDLADLGVTPSSIVGVQTRMFARKSDTGTRTARIQIKSGGTTSNGTTVTLGSTYSYVSPKVDTVDPNTSAAWTGAAVDALQIGPYVVA